MSSLATESWTWYGITWLSVVIRMISQVLLRGSVKKLKPDDVLMMVAMAFDTVLMVCINIISQTNSNLIDPRKPATLTPDDITQRRFGSKIVLVSEQMQILTIWTVKACLLLMYHRLTLSLKGNLIVKIVAGYVAVSFVVMEILYLGVWCRPFSQYWAVPPDNPQCSAATNHLITNAFLNISSDLMIIMIPMPIFLQSRISLQKKVILCAVFALGGFTILSAILNKYYSFSEPYGSAWTFCQEHINKDDDYAISLKIYQRRDVRVKSEPLGEASDSKSDWTQSLLEGLTTTTIGGGQHENIKDMKTSGSRSGGGGLLNAAPST
ncbi:decarboxylase [Purpureocillium lavendulum]|uniref:Decarboxylase n=1 Tax=Purpureocillium lavendulum TaxID=1247861 RepID=A0AB34FFG4_9HYPO|nr:decarboxylase [Purpureocillium lavendulum]